jgi:hypothetical protein
MPRAALLSLHARIDGIDPAALDDPALAQLWGPRYNTYVVPEQDFALFSLGRLPDDTRGRERAEQMAELLHAILAGERMTDGEAGAGLGMNPNRLKYAATTGTVAIRWEGARAPVVWRVPAPTVSVEDARRELARRHLHVFGPTTAAGFARWAGVSQRAAVATYASLAAELLEVRTPLGDEWLLAGDEQPMRETEPAMNAAARLLPSGDAYYLLDGAERTLLVPDADRRGELWTSRVWPGAVFVDGEIRGTWRRAGRTLRVEAWERLGPAAVEAVAAEAAALPLPGLTGPVVVEWAR